MKQLLTILCLVLLSSYSYSKEVLFSDLIERDGIVYKSTQPSTMLCARHNLSKHDKLIY
jgi:hypothetical protein